MPRCIAFHSYKGGTGKTTIAANLAALLAKNGYRVLLVDLDVYAPSLYVYFGVRPKKWINDYLLGKTEIEETMIELTSILDRTATEKTSTTFKTTGALWLALSNPKREEISKLDITAFNAGMDTNANLQILRRFIKLKEEAITKHNIDYIIIDTSPGIKFWSINSLAIADTLVLMLKMDDLDIEGTKSLVSEIYESFSELGTKSYLLLNRVSGYCVPKGHRNNIPMINPSIDHQQKPPYLEPDVEAVRTLLSSATKTEILGAIPCYCDIQFMQKEFLTCMTYPDHAFTKQLQELAESEQIKQ